eukprot:TRINITY_DN74499_c0_g1_i1.p1 TRINITY_DN74499_c0_g1~~TRINITY_DN74499_c0_g1_i1.p1  ORF type:complete len:503 (+),score=52.48 TRINITY_DN74499_c0_g1_i1:207-1511(+)
MALRRRVEDVLRRPDFRASVSGLMDIDYAAWHFVRDEGLAKLFAALSLDGRLRRHSRPLPQHGKADVLRAAVGELERDMHLATYGMERRRELVRELAQAIVDLQIHSEPWLPPPEVDAMLTTQLRCGSVPAAIARLRSLHQARESDACRRIFTTFAHVLPHLNHFRLRVFFQLLHELCRPLPAEFAPRAQAGCASNSSCQARGRTALASTVVRATLAAGLTSLPYDSVDQLLDIQRSPCLSEAESRQILDLLTSPENDFIARKFASSSCGPCDLPGDSASSATAVSRGPSSPASSSQAHADQQWRLATKARPSSPGSISETPIDHRACLAESAPVDNRARWAEEFGLSGTSLPSSPAALSTGASSSPVGEFFSSAARSHRPPSAMDSQGMRRSRSWAGSQSQDDYAAQLGRAAARFRRLAVDIDRRRGTLNSVG